MAAGSPFFARIKRDVLAIMAHVPPGRLVTFKEIGAHLDVVPRYPAYILATLDPIEAAHVPWHRAVNEAGQLDGPKTDQTGASQRALLEAEGHVIAADGRILDLGQRLIDVATLPHGIAVQKRPVDAPVASVRKRKPAAR
jgi:methylated-DNA-protein-cysteine methyltransferase related protein